LRIIKEWVFKQDFKPTDHVAVQPYQGPLNISPKIKLDQKFNSLIVNVNNLESLYRDFFNSQSTQGGIIEIKNRCFKELYGLVEESIMKVYELFTDCQSL
jgi:hypothetical protein